jgi:prepilin-type N-terminal cleavage/methylation domain-containing protein
VALRTAGVRRTRPLVRPSRERRRGFTLIEMVMTLVIVAIVAGLAVPAFSGWVARSRMRATLDELTRDVSYARMLALRSGRRAELRFAITGGCVNGYTLVNLVSPERVAKTVNVASEAPGICLSTNGSGPLAFNSRGMLAAPGNRSFWIYHGSQRDSISVSLAGRLRRWY